ncbi:PhzF family phenazine biosynthesis protein [Rhodobacter sp. HX-7-19]|uniref:PhzF family phenazine biosynthesis protein n=1 Tax=Paragemmobacter kunshanensis TaxID=2583234 RepID=A0A6M1U7E6_9RHOB|nr:PhzF family phenazine biosynthesis protein [Rhodobacter kunshanensis]NGQ89801.1 PhzF family phenazine biosynthesis protein [Rhodobacter kunshanensis]
MLEFRTLDVFTARPFTGNPLAVVLGADGLTTAQMQTIAREFNLSETIFVMAPRNAAHRARVRIFFPTAEIPFAGHPTIGCAVLLAGMDAGPGDFEAHLVLEEEAGLVPVTVWRRGGVTEAEFTAPVIPHGTEGRVHGALADALGLAAGEIGFGAHRPGIWQGGPRFLYVPVASLDVLARAGPMQPHWDAVMAAAGVDSAYLYTPGADCDFRARMFSPTAGIPEDPATGSATAILAAQLMASGALRDGETRFHLRQGVEMGRASDLWMTVEVAAGAIRAVRIRGAAVPLSDGRIAIPEA